MTPDDEREYLTSRGWEMPLSEEEGCETWRLPFELRHDYPENIVPRTQHYWDREDAVKLQLLMDRVRKSVREKYDEIQKRLQDNYEQRKLIEADLADLQTRCQHSNAISRFNNENSTTRTVCLECGLEKTK